MDYRQLIEATGERVGAEGVVQLVERAEAVCEWEQTRIELASEPALAVKKAEYAIALEQESVLKSRLYRATPPIGVQSSRRKITICWIVGSVLIIAGLVLTILTLEPYRLGIKSIFYSLGIALVAPFLVERTLDLFSNETLKRVITIVSCLAALTSLILLATIRGNLLAQQVRQDSVSAVIEGEEPQNQTNEHSFYEDTIPLLQLVMAFLAVAMEMGAGIAIHEAELMSRGLDGEYESVRCELLETRARLGQLAREIVELQNEAPIFLARFWRDFYWTMLKGTATNAAKRFMLLIAFFALACPIALRAQQRLDLVIAVDLTKSVDQTGPDGQTEFSKNISAVTQLLGQLPAGTAVTIFGITGESFAQPYILLKATLSADPGYFGEKLSSGRQQIIRTWKVRSERLQPSFKQTDLLGALLLASAAFEEHHEVSRKDLILYSDMRQASPDLNLESGPTLRTTSVLSKVEQSGLQADMTGIDVYVLGAASNERTARWQEVRAFWELYFSKAGSRLRTYSALRDLPTLEIGR